MERLLLTVDEVAEALGCGRTLVYELIRRGDLSSIKLGRLTRVPIASMDLLIQSKLDAGGFDSSGVDEGSISNLG